MAIVFPDTELWWTGHLRDAFAARGKGVFTDIDVPRQRRQLEVIVRSDGGQSGRVTTTARFGVRCFAPTKKAASDLAREAAALMRAARFTGPIREVDTTEPVPVDDPGKAYLMYFTASTTVRGAPLA